MLYAIEARNFAITEMQKNTDLMSQLINSVNNWVKDWLKIKGETKLMLTWIDCESSNQKSYDIFYIFYCQCLY